MADENGHVKKLVAARDIVVAERRSLADVLAKQNQRGHTEEEWRELFIRVQNTIEAIDRAIADETRTASVPAVGATLRVVAQDK